MKANIYNAKTCEKNARLLRYELFMVRKAPPMAMTHRRLALPILRIILTAFLCFLAGCAPFPGASGSPTPDTSVRPELHAPGLLRLRSLDQLVADRYNSRFLFLSAGIKGPSAVSASQLLITHDRTLYTVGIDDSALHPAPWSACRADFGQVAVDPTLTWLACYDSIRTVTFFTLDETQAAPIADSKTDAMRNTLIWGPGARQLTFRPYRRTCDTQIVTVNEQFTTLTPTATLRFPDFDLKDTAEGGCSLGVGQWTPDGSALELAGPYGQNLTTRTLYTLSRATLLPLLASASPSSIPPVITITKGMLTDLGTMGLPVAWNPSGKTLTAMSLDGKTIVTIDTTTGEQRTLLDLSAQLQFPDVCSLLWMPVGDALVIRLCSGAVDIGSPPPDQFYVYTPPVTPTE